jgi:hypothetical protein
MSDGEAGRGEAVGGDETGRSDAGAPRRDEGRPGGRVRIVVRTMQVGLGGGTVAGVALGDPRLGINAGLGLLVTFLPAYLRRDRTVVLSPALTLWVVSAVFLHGVGIVGVYEVVPGFDHLTHALSATVVAAVGYSTAVALDRHSDAVRFPPQFLFVYVVCFTIALGVLWEVLEFASRAVATHYGFRSPLRQFGIRDTMLDLVFDTVGAVVFGLVGHRYTGGVVDSLTERLERATPGPGEE